MLESLEGRRLFSTINVTGTPGDDVISVRVPPENGNLLVVTVNGYESAYFACTAITVSAGVGNDSVTIGSSITVNTVISGNAGNDTIQGGAGADQITGNAGTDIIYGGAGNDVISGNDGGDYLNGGDGDDVLVGGSGADDIYGGGKLTDDDSFYQNEGSNVDDGYIDDLIGTYGSSYAKTSRDTIAFYN